MSLICIVYYHINRNIQTSKGLSEDNNKRILEANILTEEVNGENPHEL